MITAADKAWVLANSKELQSGSGESVTRARVVTAEQPESYDAEYGEVTDPEDVEYDEASVTAKWFDDPSEELLATAFGGELEAAALVFVAGDADVVPGDYLVRDSTWFEVFRTALAPLGGMRACAARKK